MSPDVHGKKRALITDSGQDGWYLIELLLSRGYDVAAHSRHHVEPVAHSGRVSWHIGDFYWGVLRGGIRGHRAGLDHLLPSIRVRC
jgi:hypothetical protein